MSNKSGFPNGVLITIDDDQWNDKSTHMRSSLIRNIIKKPNGLSQPLSEKQFPGRTGTASNSEMSSSIRSL